MKAFIADLQRSIQRKGHWYFIIFFLLLISSLLFTVAITILKQQEKQRRNYEQVYTDWRYYSVFDSMVSETEDNIYNTPTMVKQLKLFNNLLKEEKSFTYLELHNNPVYIKEYNGPLENLDQYETGKHQSNHKVEIHGAGNGYYSAVKGLWIGSNIADHFNLTLSEGSFPNEQDFIWNDADTTKVVLGSSYRNTFQIGDTFCLDFFIGNKSAEVIGFLKEGESILYKNRLINLDHYLLLPQYDMNIPSSKVGSEEYHDFWFTYLMKNNGMVATKASAEYVQDIISALCIEVGLPLIYYVDEAQNRQLITFGINMQELSKITLTLSLGSMLLSIILLCIHFSLRIKDNTQYYAILCSCGYSRKKLLTIITAELILLIIAPVALGYLVAMLLGVFLMVKVSGLTFLLIPIYGILPFLYTRNRLRHFNLMASLQEGWK